MISDIQLFTKLKQEIDSTTQLPVSRQIGLKLEKWIEAGVLEPGQKLPGDSQLSKMLSVEYRSVRKAFSILVEKGLIKRVKKSGTFVMDNIYADTPNIGFFYFRETEPWMLGYVDTMQRLLAKRNFDLKIYSYDRDYFNRTDLLREVKQSNLSGAIIYSLPDKTCLQALQSLEDSNFPFVQFASYYFMNKLKAPAVRGNVKKRINDAINYLWEQGHRRIGLVYDYKGSETEEEYVRFFKEKNGFEKHRMMNVQFSGELDKWRLFPGALLAKGFLDENSETTALIVENAAVCIDYLRQAPLVGRKIPENLSLLCLHDWDAFDVVSPPLTAMTIYSESNRKLMAASAIEKLLEIIAGGYPEKGEVIEIDNQLNVRESVCSITEE